MSIVADDFRPKTKCAKSVAQARLFPQARHAVELQASAGNDSAAAGTEEAGVRLRVLVFSRGRQVLAFHEKSLEFRHRDTLLLLLLKVSI